MGVELTVTSSEGHLKVTTALPLRAVTPGQVGGAYYHSDKWFFFNFRSLQCFTVLVVRSVWEQGASYNQIMTESMTDENDEKQIDKYGGERWTISFLVALFS